MRYRSTNAWKLVLVTIACLVVEVIGMRHVIVAQDVLAHKRSIFVEVLANRRLATEKDVLLRQIAEMTAPARVALRARVLLGMRPPTSRELIFAGDEGRK